MTDTTIISGSDDIANARMLTLRKMLQLELKGLSRRGRSAYSIIKSEFNLKGSKAKVLEDFTTLINKKIPGMDLKN